MGCKGSQVQILSPRPTQKPILPIPSGLFRGPPRGSRCSAEFAVVEVQLARRFRGRRLRTRLERPDHCNPGWNDHRTESAAAGVAGGAHRPADTSPVRHVGFVPGRRCRGLLDRLQGTLGGAHRVSAHAATQGRVLKAPQPALDGRLSGARGTRYLRRAERVLEEGSNVSTSSSLIRGSARWFHDYGDRRGTVL